jgi:hypothetical protein
MCHNIAPYTFAHLHHKKDDASFFLASPTVTAQLYNESQMCALFPSDMAGAGCGYFNLRDGTGQD